MSALTDYLKKFERNLVGVDERKKRELVRDTERHIIAMSEEYGGGDSGISAVLKEIGPPEKLARSYVLRYAVSRRYVAGLAGVFIVISTFTLPVLPFLPSQNPGSLIILPILILMLVVTGMRYGVPVSLYAVVPAALWRSIVFQITIYLYPFGLAASQNGIYIVHLTSLILVLIPFAFPLPGRE